MQFCLDSEKNGREDRKRGKEKKIEKKNYTRA